MQKYIAAELRQVSKEKSELYRLSWLGIYTSFLLSSGAFTAVSQKNSCLQLNVLSAPVYSVFLMRRKNILEAKYETFTRVEKITAIFFSPFLISSSYIAASCADIKKRKSPILEQKFPWSSLFTPQKRAFY